MFTVILYSCSINYNILCKIILSCNMAIIADRIHHLYELQFQKITTICLWSILILYYKNNQWHIPLVYFNQRKYLNIFNTSETFRVMPNIRSIFCEFVASMHYLAVRLGNEKTIKTNYTKSEIINKTHCYCCEVQFLLIISSLRVVYNILQTME